MTLALAPFRKNLPPITITALFALFVIMLPRYTDTAKTWFVLLILLSAIYLLTNIRLLQSTAAALRWYFAAVVVNFLWILLCYYVNGEPDRGDAFLWGRHFYTLFLIPMYFLFRRVEISDRALVISLFAGILLSLGDMLLDLASSLDHREQGMNPNAFGPIQLCMSAMLFFYFLENPQKSLRWLALAGTLMGIASVMLSMSKSTWITAALLGFGFIFYLTRTLTLRQRSAIVVGLLLLAGAFSQLPIVEKRVDQGLQSIEKYYASDDYRDDSRLGSFGTRVELWKTGWQIFLENPLFGAGVGGFNEQARKNSERYRVNDTVHQYKYVHNQYLAALATRGFPGLILFLLVLGLPLYIALSGKADSSPARTARLSLIFLVLAYLIGCLAEDHFEGKSAIMFTGVMLPFLLARLAPRESAPVPGNPP